MVISYREYLCLLRDALFRRTVWAHIWAMNDTCFCPLRSVNNIKILVKLRSIPGLEFFLLSLICSLEPQIDPVVAFICKYQDQTDDKQNRDYDCKHQTDLFEFKVHKIGYDIKCL